MISARIFFPALLIGLVFAQVCVAVKVCNGFIGPGGPTITTDITVPPGATCTLDSVDVTGSVDVKKGATLATVGTMRIYGRVQGDNCGSLFLTDSLTVSGGVNVVACKQVDVGPLAVVGSLSTMNTATVILQGMVAVLSVRGSGNLVVQGGKVLGGGINRQLGKGKTTICGGKIRGGIMLSQVFGDFTAGAGANCKPSDICGTIQVGKGVGNINIGGGTLLGADLIVGNQKGNVEVFNSQLSDVSIQGISGALKLTGVLADSDAAISGVQKKITVTKSSFDGDFGLTNNPGSVVIQDNDFTKEDLLLSGNGQVTIQRNSNFSFTATENGGLLVANNKFVSAASVSKNTGNVELNGNQIESLTCAGNSGKFGGKGNQVIFTTDQCAKF